MADKGSRSLRAAAAEAAPEVSELLAATAASNEFLAGKMTVRVAGAETPTRRAVSRRLTAPTPLSSTKAMAAAISAGRRPPWW